MPITLRVAIGLLWAQFLALLGLLVIFAVLLVQEPSVLGVYVGAFMLLVTVALFFMIRALRRLSAAARGGVIALELLALAPAYYMITGGRAFMGLPLAAVSIAVMVLLLTPQTNRALG